MKSDAKYWLVGAYWESPNDLTDVFIAGGYWEMGYKDRDKPEYADLRDQMKPGDRIAIKARGGRGKSYLIIKAIGIIQAVDPYSKRVYVDWKLTNLAGRQVSSKGKFRTIHPPLSNPDWINAIFTL